MTSAGPWWATAVFYQIYPRSFADGNGDGIGDLIGIRERLPYLRELGIDAVWISPFYRSPMADGGYDVADPCDVDPIFGTLADFDAFLADAHALGIRVTVDLVPNHVSDQHVWFQQALRDPSKRDRFIFREGRAGGPPNNWPSAFGGPAWTQVEDGSWYLHLFAPEQPDLDWTNPEVLTEYERVLRFWLDRGVDGFRVDVAHGLAKQPGLPDLPDDVLNLLHAGAAAHPGADFRWDRDAVHEYHRAMRRVLDSYDGDRMAVGEIWVSDPARLALYVRPDEFNLAFNFELLEVPWSASAFRGAVARSMAAIEKVGAPLTWVLANHDVDRAATRYGSLDRARAAALMQLSLPGAVYVYNGDELGLANVDIPDDALQDVTRTRKPNKDEWRGRDGERVPLPWSGTEAPYGFSTSATTWLPMPDYWAPLTVSAEEDDPDSTLSLYRDALRLRRGFVGADFAWLDAPGECLSYRRGELTVLLNAGSTSVPLPSGKVVLASGPVTDDLPPDTAVWLS